MIQNATIISLPSNAPKLTNIEFVLNLGGHDYTFLIQRNKFDNSLNNYMNNRTIEEEDDDDDDDCDCIPFVYGDGKYGEYPYKNIKPDPYEPPIPDGRSRAELMKAHPYYMTVFYDDETILATGILLTQYNDLLAGNIIPGFEMYVQHKIDPDMNKPVDTDSFNEWNLVYGLSVR